MRSSEADLQGRTISERAKQSPSITTARRFDDAIESMHCRGKFQLGQYNIADVAHFVRTVLPWTPKHVFAESLSLSGSGDYE